MRAALATLCLFVTLTAPPHGLHAQEAPYSGVFTAVSEAGELLTLTLEQARTGLVLGTLTGEGTRYRLEGRIEARGLVGTLSSTDVLMHFEAEPFASGLWVTLYGADGRGRPDYGNYEELDFYVPGSEPAGATRTPAPDPPRYGAEAPSGGNPLAGGGTDPFVGTFTDGLVTLRLQGVGGRYQGQVVVGGRTYPVTASGGASGLQGVLETADGSYPMAVQPLDGGLFVVSGGEQYHLYRSEAGPYGGPLGRRGRGYPQGGAGPLPGPGGRGAYGRGLREDHPDARTWSRLLSGTRLARIEASWGVDASGYPSRADVHLCADGSFLLRDGGVSPVDPSTGAPIGGRRSDGVWSVASDGARSVLVLGLWTGQTLELFLERIDELVYVDGRRVLTARAELCP